MTFKEFLRFLKECWVQHDQFLPELVQIWPVSRHNFSAGQMFIKKKEVSNIIISFNHETMCKIHDLILP